MSPNLFLEGPPCSRLSRLLRFAKVQSTVDQHAGMYITSYLRSCLPSSSLDLFHSSCLQLVLRSDGLEKASFGLSAEGLDLFHRSCVQHSLRHPEGGLYGDSLPTTALDWFHFSAMRRLLHNSGKCLMSEAALNIFVGSLIQQTMASELETSLKAISHQVSTHYSQLTQLPFAFLGGAHNYHSLPKYNYCCETAGYLADINSELQTSIDDAHFTVQRALCHYCLLLITGQQVSAAVWTFSEGDVCQRQLRFTIHLPLLFGSQLPDLSCAAAHCWFNLLFLCFYTTRHALHHSDFCCMSSTRYWSSSQHGL